jgi:hypothetical protein
MAMSHSGLGIKKHCAAEDQQQFTRELVARVEAASNISTVALRVVGGNEKGTQCLWV